jgi:signal transduction histidine kinase
MIKKVLLLGFKNDFLLDKLKGLNFDLSKINSPTLQISQNDLSIILIHETFVDAMYEELNSLSLKAIPFKAALILETKNKTDDKTLGLITNCICDYIYIDDLSDSLLKAKLESLFFSLEKEYTAHAYCADKDLLKKAITVRDKALAHIHEVNTNILMSIKSGIILIDPSGLIVMVNKEASNLLLIEETVIGSHYQNILPLIFNQIVEHILNSEITASYVTKMRFDKLHLRISGFTMTNNHGQCKGIFLMIQNISEEEEVSLKLDRAERLASLGTMLSGITHELRNPLSIISARCQQVVRNSDRGIDWYLKAFESIDLQVNRCATIINNLLDFVRIRNCAKTLIPLSEVISDAVLFAKYHSNFKDIEIKNLCTSNHIVLGDRNRFVQAILNIITNALDAMSGTGILIVEYQSTVPDYIQIVITDTGCGIPPEMLEKIYDPFFTTKDPGKGTGLGLSITYRIIQESGGTINCTSAPGKTTFIITLPLATELNNGS